MVANHTQPIHLLFGKLAVACVLGEDPTLETLRHARLEGPQDLFLSEFESNDGNDVHNLAHSASRRSDGCPRNLVCMPDRVARKPIGGRFQRIVNSLDHTQRDGALFVGLTVDDLQRVQLILVVGKELSECLDDLFGVVLAVGVPTG